MLERVDLLSPDDCDRVRRTVFELRPHWRERSLLLSQGARPVRLQFFTLGAASYLDAKPGSRAYYEQARESNPLLRRHFDWLYDRLPAAIERACGSPARFDDGYALPGFHVFLPEQQFEWPVASVHFDVQHEDIDWTGRDVSFANPISFTAAVSLPEGGAGMHVWELTRPEIQRAGNTPASNAVLLRQRPMTYVEYQLGGMVVHSGHLVHQIAPLNQPHAVHPRITLQGHGITAGGSQLLYW